MRKRPETACAIATADGDRASCSGPSADFPQRLGGFARGRGSATRNRNVAASGDPSGVAGGSPAGCRAWSFSTHSRPFGLEAATPATFEGRGHVPPRSHPHWPPRLNACPAAGTAVDALATSSWPLDCFVRAVRPRALSAGDAAGGRLPPCIGRRRPPLQGGSGRNHRGTVKQEDAAAGGRCSGARRRSDACADIRAGSVRDRAGTRATGRRRQGVGVPSAITAVLVLSGSGSAMACRVLGARGAPSRFQRNAVGIRRAAVALQATGTGRTISARLTSTPRRPETRGSSESRVTEGQPDRRSRRAWCWTVRPASRVLFPPRSRPAARSTGLRRVVR